MKHRRTLVRSALALVGALSLSSMAPPVSAAVLQFQFGTPSRPIQGRRYETMRRLAHYLDEVSQHAYSEATDDSDSRYERYRRGNGRVIEAIADFASQANEFNDRLNGYIHSPYDLSNEVVALDQLANRVDRRIARAGANPHLRNDWSQVKDALQRMKNVLYGREVGVPRDWNRYNRGYDPYMRFGNDSFGFSIPLP